MATLAVIIPAAGSGTRMKSEVPKPFLKIGGRTILEWTVSRFSSLSYVRQVIVVTGPESIERAKRLLEQDHDLGTVELHVLEGGSDRQESVGKGLAVVKDVDLVAVHDAVRPFVKIQYIDQCCHIALECGGAVLGIPARDTIKECDKNGYVRKTPDRSRLWQCQTPQIFPLKVFMEAFRKSQETGFKGTDDASLVEHMRRSVRMVEGDASNIKITYPQDMILAEMLIERQKEE